MEVIMDRIGQKNCGKANQRDRIKVENRGGYYSLTTFFKGNILVRVEISSANSSSSDG